MVSRFVGGTYAEAANKDISPKGGGANSDWRRLYNDGFHDLLSLANIIRTSNQEERDGWGL